MVVAEPVEQRFESGVRRATVWGQRSRGNGLEQSLWDNGLRQRSQGNGLEQWSREGDLGAMVWEAV